MVEKKKQKKKRAPSAWNIHSMKVFGDMKKKDPAVKFSDALKAAKKSYKKQSRCHNGRIYNKIIQKEIISHILKENRR